jgi:hypothetical protein
MYASLRSHLSFVRAVDGREEGGGYSSSKLTHRSTDGQWSSLAAPLWMTYFLFCSVAAPLSKAGAASAAGRRLAARTCVFVSRAALRFQGVRTKQKSVMFSAGEKLRMARSVKNAGMQKNQRIRRKRGKVVVAAAAAASFGTVYERRMGVVPEYIGPAAREAGREWPILRSVCMGSWRTAPL